MCGIAGIVNLGAAGKIEVDELRAMSDAIFHRGPDSSGFHIDPEQRCGLAFRRLSIIDLAGGQQPICNETGDIWLVFNGEIYNYRELRDELVSKRHVFKTRSDSEVIVHLYEELGDRCIDRLSGMFAIAIWDAPRRRLLLARDRFGKKPLVYLQHEHRLYFASEMKAILAIPSSPRTIDPQSIHRYLTFQYVPAPHSIYTGHAKLPPGHIATLDLSAREPAMHISRYYDVETVQPWAESMSDAKSTGVRRHSPSYSGAKQRLATLLTRAVDKRLISDVPLGAFLSGGVDSSIVVALMRKLGVSPLRTFSIGFNDPRYDERAFARRVSDRFQTEHHEHVVTPDAKDMLSKLAFHFDEPFADSSAIPTWYVSHWARHSVTVALTGDAGDECFGGYDRYRAALLASRFDALPPFVRAGIAQLAGSRPPPRARSLRSKLYRFLHPLRQTGGRRYARWMMVLPPELLTGAYRPEFAERLDFDEPLRWFSDIYQRQRGGVIDRVTRTDIATYLPFDLLTKVDIASMAVSLECRSPLLDHELVEFALGLPAEWRTGKRILKDWARELLPAEILTRPKMGFGVPVGEWMRSELREWVEGHLLSERSLCSQIFRRDWLRNYIDAHVSRIANHEHPLWALLMLELWHERWGGVLET